MPKPTTLWCGILSFEASVRPAAVVEVNWEATAGGIKLKRERVTDSPGQPEAVISLEPRDGVRGRVPIGEDTGSEVPKPVSGGSTACGHRCVARWRYARRWPSRRSSSTP